MLYGGNRVQKAKLERSFCCATFLVFLLTMVSLAGCEIMNSEVAASIFTVIPIQKKEKKKREHLMFKNL